MEELDFNNITEDNFKVLQEEPQQADPIEPQQEPQQQEQQEPQQ